MSDLERLAEEAEGAEAVLAMAVLPRAEHPAAAAAWPALAGELASSDAYCRAVEARVREATEVFGRRPLLVEVRVEEVERVARAYGLDPAHPDTHARTAAEIAGEGEGAPWPPGRNDACWCRSGRKYKRCCGR